MAQTPKKKQTTPSSPSKSKKPVLKDIFIEQRGFWQEHWKEALIILVAVLGLYLRTIPYEFVLDDQIVIVDNKYTKKGFDGIADIFAHDSFMGYFGEQKDLVAGSRYRPLSLALFAVIHQFAGLDARIYHIVNALLYGLLCLLVYRVLALMLHNGARDRSRWWIAAPFLGALVYALHPVHTEAVANIKGCDEVLAMLGAMGALYGAFHFAYRRSWAWLVLSALSFFAGLFAKENTITYAAVIPLALYFFTKCRFSTIVVATVPVVLASVAYVAIRLGVIGFLFSENTAQDLLNNPFVEMNGDQKAATILYTLGLYLKLLFFPYPLTHDYYPYHIPIMEWADWRTLLSGLLYIGVFAAGLIGLFRRKVYGFAALYFLATLSIVSNVFFPIGTFMNERFLFMPSLALSVLFGHYVGALATKDTPWKRILAYVLSALVVLGFMWRSWVRIPAWENTLSLNSSAIKVSKNSARANCFMGTALYQEALKIDHAGEHLAEIRKAEIYIDKSLEIVPDYLSANQMKSGIAAEYYKYDRDLDKLLTSFAEIIERRPGTEYVAQYCEYLNKRDVDVQKMLDFYYHVGFDILTIRKQKYDYALKYLLYGFQLDPNNARINYGMGRAYLGWGDKQRSDFHLERAYMMDPSLKKR